MSVRPPMSTAPLAAGTVCMRFDNDSGAASVAKAAPTVRLGELQGQILKAKAVLKRAQKDRKNDG